MIEQFLLLLKSQASEQTKLNSQGFCLELGLQMVDENFSLAPNQGAFEFVDDKLQLHLLLDNKTTQLAFDFIEGEVGFRVARVSKSNEVIAKAIGCKPHYRPRVLDATAGMGRDSLIMASLGCQVTMLERNPAIYQLLNNALLQFQKHDEYRQLPGKLSLISANSIESDWLSTDFDVVYLDPMFPERKKSALVKKEMRLFKLLAGDDPDADQLMQRALASKAKRVVVKRPKGAPLLADKKPSHEIVAKKFRYDVYLLG